MFGGKPNWSAKVLIVSSSFVDWVTRCRNSSGETSKIPNMPTLFARRAQLSRSTVKLRSPFMLTREASEANAASK